jgi:DNA polymerase-3 subunit delta'
MQFSEVPGLNELKSQLIHSFQKGKVAHAQLFTGIRGSATFPMAMAYATYLMCQNRTDQDSCGTCSNCVRIKKSIHPDVHWYFPKIAASKKEIYEKVLAEALPLWRNFVIDSPFGSFDDWALHYNQENKNLQLSREDSRQIFKNVSMHAVEGGYKIIFIWGVEYMHPTGANAILKILEEPPEMTIYIMVTFNYDLLLQTITSRSQLINVPPNLPEEIEEFLLSRNIEKERAQQLAKISQGRIGVALNLVHSEEEMAYKQFRDWMLACWNRDFTYLVNLSEDFHKTRKAHQRGFLMYSISLIRNSLLKFSGNSSVIINKDEDAFVSKYSDKLGLGKLQEMYELLNEALKHLDRNSNPRITHLNLSLDIVKKINS